MAEKRMIVYYSWVGNTAAVAEEIKAQTGIEVCKIEEEKERAPKKYGSAAMGAFFGRKSKIKPMDFKMSGCEEVLLGLQVWAGKTTPAINTFLSKADFTGKKVYLFITKADDKVPQKIIDSVTERIQKKGGTVVDTFSVTTVMDRVISLDQFKEDLFSWLTKNHMV